MALSLYISVRTQAVLESIVLPVLELKLYDVEENKTENNSQAIR